MSVKKNTGKTGEKKHPKGKGSESTLATKAKPTTSASPATANTAAASGMSTATSTAVVGGVSAVASTSDASSSSVVSKSSQTPYSLTIGRSPFGQVTDSGGTITIVRF
jgi:hypothetical protein